MGTGSFTGWMPFLSPIQ